MKSNLIYCPNCKSVNLSTTEYVYEYRYIICKVFCFDKGNIKHKCSICGLYLYTILKK